MKYPVTRIQIKGEDISTAFWFLTYNKEGIDMFADGGLLKNNKHSPNVPYHLTIPYKQEQALIEQAISEYFMEQLKTNVR